MQFSYLSPECMDEKSNHDFRGFESLPNELAFLFFSNAEADDGRRIKVVVVEMKQYVQFSYLSPYWGSEISTVRLKRIENFMPNNLI